MRFKITLFKQKLGPVTTTGAPAVMLYPWAQGVGDGSPGTKKGEPFLGGINFGSEEGLVVVRLDNAELKRLRDALNGLEL